MSDRFEIGDYVRRTAQFKDGTVTLLVVDPCGRITTNKAEPFGICGYYWHMIASRAGNWQLIWCSSNGLRHVDEFEVTNERLY